MRIAQFCPYDIDRIGGVQRHIHDLSRALKELGHEVTIVAPHVQSEDVVPHRPVEPGEPSILNVGRGVSIHLANTVFEISIAIGKERRRLTEIVSDGRFDVIHYHTMYTPVMPVQALNSSRCANIATFHDTPQDTFTGGISWRYLNTFSRWLLPRLDAIIAVSPVPLRHLALREEQRPNIVPPCVDLRPFSLPVPPMEKYRDDRLNILFVGRLEMRKGPMFLLRAYAKLCADGVKARLLIVGEGPERAAMERFVAQHALPEVVFCGFDRDTPRWYSTCDIFCAPSIYGEGFGIVVAEAMTSGKPVVAAANPAYQFLLTDEAKPFLTPPGDVDAIYRSLRVLVGDAPLRQRLGVWGRRAAAKFDYRVVAPKIVSIYEEALRSPVRPHRRFSPAPAVRLPDTP